MLKGVERSGKGWGKPEKRVLMEAMGDTAPQKLQSHGHT